MSVISLVGVVALLLLGGGGSLTLLLVLGVLAVALLGFALPSSAP